MRTHRVVGVVLLGVALLLVANPLYVYQYPDEVNRVRIVTDGEPTPAANYSAGELSPRARELVRETVESDANRTTFRGDHRRPPEFEFAVDRSGGLDVAGEVYAVEYDGRSYLVRTYRAPRALGAEASRSRGLVGLGVVVGLVGGAYLRRDQPLTLGVSLAAVAAGLLVLNLASRYADGALGPVAVLGSAPFVFLGLFFAIASLGYLVYRTMRERRLDRLARRPQ